MRRVASMLARAGLATGVSTCLVLSLPAPLVAQDEPPERIAVTVDYVSIDGIYLPVGADQGLTLGDTVAVYTDSLSATPSGRLAFVSVTRRRSVAQAVDPSLALARGDVFFVALTATPAGGSTAPEVVAVGPDVAVASRTRASTTRADAGGPRLSGRITLDVDARETRTSWSGDLFGETTRRFATPTSRLSLVVSELPGGFSLRTSLRASYRYDQLQNGPPPVSVRAYQAVAVRSWDAVQIMVGRFSSPYESYSAYWDGALVRVGGTRGPGIGMVAGFEPVLFNEGFSSELPKITGFADLALRGDGWRYDTDVSVHLLRPPTGQRWSYAGWSQSISLGPLDLSQRLRIDGGLDGRSPQLGDVRARAQLQVGGPFGVHGSYGRSERSVMGPAVDDDGLTLPLELVPREDISVGVDLRGRRGQLWVDAGQAKRDGDTSGRYVSGHTSVALGGARLLLSGRHWRHGDSRSLGAAPALAFGIWGISWTVAYRYYDTRSATSSMATNAADLRIALTLAEVFRVTARAEHQWGSNLAGDRVQLGVSRSF